MRGQKSKDENVKKKQQPGLQDGGVGVTRGGWGPRTMLDKSQERKKNQDNGGEEKL